MKRLVILLITIVSLGLFSSSAWAIADDYYSLPTLEDTYKNRDLAKERFNKDMNKKAMETLNDIFTKRNYNM